MKNILCFGDSNTFGYHPVTQMRFDENTRWTGVLAHLLGEGYRVIEEGLGGRTTVYDDPVSPDRNGFDYLLPCLMTHKPLDLVILMLGTNDMKPKFSTNAEEISKGLERLVEVILNPYIWDAYPVPKLLVVSPILIGETITSSAFCTMFGGEKGVALSKELAGVCRQVAGKYGCGFLDAAQVAEPSGADAIHMDEENHRKLATALAGVVKAMV